VAHLSAPAGSAKEHNSVAGKEVPVRHFGGILEMAQWRKLEEKLGKAEVKLVIAPGIRLAGQAGEQATFFLRDPSGNALEFKAFARQDQIFAR